MSVGPCARLSTLSLPMPTAFPASSMRMCSRASATGATRRLPSSVSPGSTNSRRSAWRPSRRNTTPTGTSPSTRTCPSLLSICPSLAILGTEAEPLPLAAEAQPEYRRAQVPTPSMETQAGVTTSEEPANPTIRRRRRSGSPPPLDDDTYELVKLLLEEKSVISSADVQELTGLNTVAVRSLLKRLVDEGCAVQVGHGRGTRYRYRAQDH